MKTLAELRTEIDLGLEAYPTTHHDVIVTKWEEYYVFLRYEDGTQREHLIDTSSLYLSTCIQFFAEDDGSGGILVDKEDCYTTFDELLADWPRLAALSVWGTTKTPERLMYETMHRQAMEG